MKRLAIIILVGLPLLLVVLGSMFKKVPLDRVGVRIINFGPGSGIDQQDLAPGYHWISPAYHDFYLFDTTLQVLVFGDDGTPPISLTATDQYTSLLDVTVVYHIQPGQAHKVAQVAGLGDRFKVLLRSAVNKAVWEVLAVMQTEDLYNVKIRTERSQMAEQQANEELAKQGVPIQVDDILIRDVVYDDRFEEKLLRKQVLDQERLLFTAQAHTEAAWQVTQTIQKETQAKLLAISETKEQALKTLVAETDAKINHFQADAEYESRTLIAQSEQSRRQALSEGDLVRAQARAKGDKAINDAYRGAGGQYYLAKLMIENLEIGDIELNTNRVNPFDVADMLEMVGAELEKAEK